MVKGIIPTILGILLITAFLVSGCVETETPADTSDLQEQQPEPESEEKTLTPKEQLLQIANELESARLTIYDTADKWSEAKLSNNDIEEIFDEIDDAYCKYWKDEAWSTRLENIKPGEYKGALDILQEVERNICNFVIPIEESGAGEYLQVQAETRIKEAKQILQGK